MAFINPGIPSVIIFLSRRLTDKNYIFNKNIKEDIENERYPPYETIYSYGDGRSPTFSTLLPSLRWAY